MRTRSELEAEARFQYKEALKSGLKKTADTSVGLLLEYRNGTQVVNNGGRLTVQWDDHAVEAR